MSDKSLREAVRTARKTIAAQSNAFEDGIPPFSVSMPVELVNTLLDGIKLPPRSPGQVFWEARLEKDPLLRSYAGLSSRERGAIEFGAAAILNRFSLTAEELIAALERRGHVPVPLKENIHDAYRDALEEKSR